MNRTPVFFTVVAGIALFTACNGKHAPEDVSTLDGAVDATEVTVGLDHGEDGHAEGGEKAEEQSQKLAVLETKESNDPAPPEEPEAEEADDDFDYAVADATAAPAPRAPESKPEPSRTRNRPSLQIATGSKDKRKKGTGIGGLGTAGRGDGAGGAAYGAGISGLAGHATPHQVVTVPTVPAPDVVSSNEDYTNYGINDFTITDKDALSTFAIDVDTASYAITRSKLRGGYLPSTSAVRVEEFVNYFDYEYKRPAKSDPFTVDFEASPSPYNPRNTLVRVGVQGKRVSYDTRKPVHLTFLVDVSGSMQNTNKIGMVKKTLTMLTEELEDGDTVAIATYAGRTEVVLEPTPMSKKGDIIRALNRLSAGGSTAMSSGIDLAYRLADSSYREGAVNRVIVCSDGDANVGPSSHDVISKQIKGYANKGITLTTVGVGNGNYKDTMMERLANDGDGNYYYIDSEAEARRVFVDKLTGTMEVIAKDVKIQVEWNPEDVVAYRLIGYENRDVADKDFRNDKVDAGEIGAGHQVTAIYELALADGASGQLGTVRVRNKAPGPDSPAVERSFALSSDTIRTTFAETSDQYRIAVAAMGFAEILRGSPHMAETSLGQVASIAKGAARAEYHADAELVELIETAARLKGEGAYTAR